MLISIGYQDKNPTEYGIGFMFALSGVLLMTWSFCFEQRHHNEFVEDEPLIPDDEP